MTAEGGSLNDYYQPQGALASARFYASIGLRVVPIPAGMKWPQGLAAWQDAATVDSDIIDAWWTGLYKDHGVGIVTGARSGIWALDVDAPEGLRSLRKLVDEHGPLPRTVTARTGGGGLHILFQWDPNHPIRNIQSRPDLLGKGLDVRGEGGQIVVYPSIHPNGTRYEWGEWPLRPQQKEKWGDGNIVAAPQWLYEKYDTVAVTDKPKKVPTEHQIDPDSPADAVYGMYDYAELLESDGWTHHSTHGDDTWWTRPDKTPQDGHSAVLHGPDGPLVVFSSNAPPELLEGARIEADGGTGWVLSLFDYLTATQHGGDSSAAAKAVRKLMPDLTAWATTGTATSPPDGRTAPAPTPRPQQAHSKGGLADVFDAREELAHIRDAAWSRLVGAEGVFGAVLGRVAFLTPPHVRIPPIVGAEGTLDYITALVAPSGIGKTTSVAVARELLEVPAEMVKYDGLEISTGQGIAEKYMGEVDEVDDEGKKKKVRRQVAKAVLFKADEGQRLYKMGTEKGSILLETIRSAWSGAALGQANASAEADRFLPAKAYRFVLLVGIQPAYAADIMGETVGGTAQRFTWWHSAEARPGYATAPTWPGSLAIEPIVTFTLGGDIEVRYPQAVVDEVRRMHDERSIGREAAAMAAAIDSHRNMVKLKTAYLLARLAGRNEEVTIEDWELAGACIDYSDSVRSIIAEAAEEQKQAKMLVQVEDNAAFAEAMSQHEWNKRLRQAVAQIVARMEREGPLTSGEAGKALASRVKGALGGSAEAVRLALEYGLADGSVEEVGDGTYRARS